jgi:tetratricopeptide (TPR) repeat protein
VQLSDYAKARPLLEGYLAKEPENAMALGVLAILELAEKKYDAALELLDRAIAISPTWPTPYLDAAGIAATKGDQSQAVRYLEQALLIAAPSEVYQQYSSAAFREIRTTDAGKELEKKIADEARKSIP